MMKLLFCIALTGLLQVTLCGEYHVVSIYVDRIFNRFKRSNEQTIKEIDPVPIAKFSSYNLQIWDGMLHGVTKLWRSGECSAIHGNNSAKFTCKLFAKNLRLDANLRSKVTWFWIPGKIQSPIDDYHATIALKARRNMVELDSFNVTKVGKLQLPYYTGYTFLLNWALETTLEQYESFLSKLIISGIQDAFIPFIRTRIAELPYLNSFFSESKLTQSNIQQIERVHGAGKHTTD